MRPLGLDLQVLQGEAGMDNIIRSAGIQKLGLALAGFTGHRENSHPAQLCPQFNGHLKGL